MAIHEATPSRNKLKMAYPSTATEKELDEREATDNEKSRQTSKTTAKASSKPLNQMYSKSGESVSTMNGN